MTRPTMDQVLLEMAALMATRSTCSRAAVGCVVARDGRNLASGYNGAPAGLPHCQHPLAEKTTTAAANAVGCRDAVHAEANAIAFAAKHGVSLNGAELFTTLDPCLACAQLIVNAGIVRVVSGERYRNDDGPRLLRRAGIVVVAADGLAPRRRRWVKTP